MDFLETIKGVDMMTWGIAAVLVVFAVVLFWDKLPSFSLPKIGGGGNERVAMLGKLDDLYAFFEQHKCEEGMNGVKDLVQHVFDDHPHA
jgi:hypothetical protein